MKGKDEIETVDDEARAAIEADAADGEGRQVREPHMICYKRLHTGITIPQELAADAYIS